MAFSTLYQYIEPVARELNPELEDSFNVVFKYENWGNRRSEFLILSVLFNLVKLWFILKGPPDDPFMV